MHAGSERLGRPKGGLREAQRRFTRQHILDAAIDVFVEKGYIAATVEDIIDRAGTSRRTFYAHFRNKSQVLAEIGESLTPEIKATFARLDDVLLEGSPEAFRAWIQSTMEASERYGSLLPVWEQAMATEPEHEVHRRELVESYPDLMPRYLARWPKSRQDEARLRVVLLTLELDRFFAHRWPRDMEPAERARAADVLTDIWFDALQTPRKGGR
jgi:AcrR family transcriptional regulator